MTQTRLHLLVVFVLLAIPSGVFAHRLDEYLQATLVDVSPGAIRLEINLTPGVDVADQLLPLFDPNRDGVISTSEAEAYVESMKHDLVARLDDREVDLKLTSSDFPAPDDLRSGWGIIQLEFSIAPLSLAAGAHTLTLQNHHLGAVSVYLFNAALPRSKMIQIREQIRNENQSMGRIDFTFEPPATVHARLGVPASVASLVVLASPWVFRKARQARA